MSGRSARLGTTRAIATAVGCSSAHCLVTAAGFFCFLLACGLGLKISSSASMSADLISWATGAVVVGGAILTLLIYVMMRWRTRSSRSGAWVVAGVLGLLTAGASAAFALVEGLLLTSATWGNHAGSDFFERNRLVEAAAPAWLWWLLALFLAFAGVTGVLMFVPATRADGRRRYRWYAYAGLAAVPVSTLGVLATTAALAL